MLQAGPAGGHHDVIVVGAGGAGLICAATAGRRGRSVLVLEHNDRPGLKILISGGGRCNFTNRRVGADNYVSGNLHFARSALARFTPDDFLALVERHAIPFHERKWGQLFCNDSARRISQMLLGECAEAGVQLATGARIRLLDRYVPEDPASPVRFRLVVDGASGERELTCASLVVATGGLSYARLGATDFGYRLARRFGLAVVPPRPGLVPLLFSRPDARRFGDLAGIAVFSRVTSDGADAAFEENVLFTHGGLSGPAILQISNYWKLGHALEIDLLPQRDLLADLLARKAAGGNEQVRTLVAEHLPRRLVERLLDDAAGSRPVSQSAERDLAAAAAAVKRWRVLPAADAGYEKAEVTLGGVDTSELSSRTLESRRVPGLYFIGEVVDVTGWLGGFNFQWAWASGVAAGEAV